MKKNLLFIILFITALTQAKAQNTIVFSDGGEPAITMTRFVSTDGTGRYIYSTYPALSSSTYDAIYQTRWNASLSRWEIIYGGAGVNPDNSLISPGVEWYSTVATTPYPPNLSYGNWKIGPDIEGPLTLSSATGDLMGGGASLPTVTTTGAASITATSATLGGNISSNGGATLTARGIVYVAGSTASPVFATSGAVTVPEGGTGTGTFTQTPTLSASTTYHYQAYATNSQGTSYGGDKSFTTTAAVTAPTSITYKDDFQTTPKVLTKDAATIGSGSISFSSGNTNNDYVLFYCDQGANLASAGAGGGGTISPGVGIWILSIQNAATPITCANVGVGALYYCVTNDPSAPPNSTNGSGGWIPINGSSPNVLNLNSSGGTPAAPTVTGISPTSGPTGGGTTVVITGTNFTGATAVTFGAATAPSFTVNSATQITAAAPAGSAGTVDARVTTTGGTSATSASDQFTYIAAPTVTAISPTKGPTSGGTTVVITGTKFTGATAVTFGGTTATSFTVNSATQITATAPAGSAGTVDTRVTTTGGTSATGASDRFTYIAAPTVTAISPTSGPTGGGTNVVITGTNFTGATAVTFGGTAPTNITVTSATQITATSPAGTGTVDAMVTTPGGTSATSASDQFTYIAAPTVTGISPTSGPTSGGTTVVITGTNFTGATAVTFGATPATGFTVNSATQITATAPAGSAGTVDARVTTTGGTSATSASDQFTYIAAPTVTSISPTSSPTSGGTTVVITGTNFTGATAVTFGATPATGVIVISATQITATAPAGSAGTVDARVTTTGGTSATSANDQFTYIAAPTVTSISPTSGPTGGGTTVVITGTNFSGATAVTFGATAATNVTVNSATQITATSPAGTGTVDVRITSPGGTSATSASDQFTYIAAPTVTAISPTSGPTSGGTTVVITGTKFTGATAVTFGAATSTGFTVNSATQITATAPAGVGTVDARITTMGGTSATSASDQFTYIAAPTVTGISPTSGPTSGGTTVVITGTNFTGATAVTFGATAATNVTVNSATQITATAPAGSAGTVDTRVTTTGGTSATGASDQFTYIAAPTVTGISPTSGPTSGGTTVVITGTNFTGATAVTFGATTATSFTVNSAIQITATSPAGSAGTIDTRVTTTGGTSATGASDQFTYVAAPTVTALSPTSGLTDGGTTVVITGTKFTGATAVTFGGTPATGFTVNSATQITATSPAASAGTVDVRVTTIGGTSATSASDQFTYVIAPTLSTVSIASNNTNTALAKTGDIITVSFTSSEDIGTPSATIAGVAATISGSGSSWTAKHTLSGSETEGAIEFNISFADIAGNAGIDVSAVTDGSSVVFDKTPPTVSIGSPSVALATTGPVTYTVTYNDGTVTLAGADVTLNKTGTADATVAVTGTGLTRTVTLSDIIGDGSIGISLASGTAKDGAGNLVAAAGPSSTFKVYNTAPTNIALSNASVDENQPSATTIGSFSSTGTNDSNGDTYTYSLVSGTGDDNNSKFTIDGSGNLLTAASFDYETVSSHTYSIRVKTTDAAGLTFEKAFTITINNVNDAPVAVTDTYSTIKNIVLNVTSGNGLLSNDTDADGDELTAILVTGPAHGSLTLNPNGSLTYTPVTDYTGFDSFTYKVNDGTTDGNTVTVTVNVANPVITLDAGSLNAMTTTYGTASDSQNFTVSGTNLTTGILVTPPAGYEVSTDNSTFTSTVTLTPTSNAVTLKVVYIRLKATAAADTYPADNVVLSSTDASSVNVPTASGTVSRFLVTVTANNALKTYGETLSNETGSVKFTTSATLPNSEFISTVDIAYGTGAAATDAADIYTTQITPSGASGPFAAGNYTISYTNGDIIVAKRTLTITAVASDKTYDGSDNATVVLSDDRVNSDVFTTSYTSVFNDKNVGDNKTVSVSGISISDGTSGNYTLAGSTATASANITARAINVTAQTDSKVYDGTISSSVAPVVDALQTGDVVATAPVQQFHSRDVATDKTLTASGLVINDGNSGNNYAVNYVDNNTGIISPAAITVTANAQSKTYGDADPELTYQTTSGSLISGDTFSGALTREAGEAVGTYPITQGTLSLNSNYTLSYSGANFTIKAQAIATLNNLILSQGAALSPVFNSGTHNYTSTVPNTVTSIAITPTVTDANATLTVNGVAVTSGTASSDMPLIVGSNTITIKVTAQDGITTGIYKVSVKREASGVATLSSVTASNGVTLAAAPGSSTEYTAKVGYNVTTISLTPTVTDPIATIKLNGHTVASGSSSAVPLSVGLNKVIIIVTAQDGSKTQYTVSITRDKGDQNITFAALPQKTYGDVDFALNATSTNTSVAITYSSDNTNVATIVNGNQVHIVNAGIANITAKQAASGTFTQAAVTQLLTINKAAIEVTADAQSKTFGSADPALTYTITGGKLFNSDIFTGKLTRDAGEATGSYSIKQGTLALSNNYVITYISAKLVIGTKMLTITANDKSKIYGQANPKLTLSYSGFVKGDDETKLTKQPAITTTATATSGAGAYDITISGAVLPGYAIKYVKGSLTINKADLAVTADNKTRAYGAVNPQFTVSYDGFVNGDTQASLNAPATAATTATATSAPGSYPITASNAASANYNFTYMPGTLTITPLGNAALTNLAISDGTLSPAFASNTYSYTASVGYDVGFIAVTPAYNGPVTVTVNGMRTGNGAASGFISLNEGDNTITIITTAQDGVNSKTYTLTLHRAVAPAAIVATNVLSPNGDGKNDGWAIKDIQLYPNNTVTVYDRAGRVVYSKQGYNNDWNGTLRGAPLTEGTYFYIIDLGPQLQKIKGYITVLSSR